MNETEKRNFGHAMSLLKNVKSSSAEANLKTLRNLDDQVDSILLTVSLCVVYEFRENAWVGFFFQSMFFFLELCSFRR